MRRMIAYLCLMSLAALLAGCAPEPGQDSPQASEPQYQPADTASQAPNEGQPYPRQASSSQESQAPYQGQSDPHQTPKSAQAPSGSQGPWSRPAGQKEGHPPPPPRFHSTSRGSRR